MSSVASGSRIYYGWYVLAAAALMEMIGTGAASYGAGLFILPLQAEFGISRATANSSLLILFLGSALAAPFLGRALDRFSIRWIIFSGGLSFCLGFLIIASTSSLLVMALALLVPAAIGFMATSMLVTTTLVSRWFYRHRFNEALGLKRGAKVGPVFNENLYVFARAPQPRPLYDTHRRGGGERGIAVTVARTIDDFLRVTAIRSAVYVAEQECPYEEEFDGNDFSATHLLGFVGDEPAGCMRIRFFADFAKIERLAVRKEFRHTRLSFQLVRAGFDLCKMKGYRRLYGHSQKRLVNFWSRFGFRVFEGRKEFSFSDFDYVEIVADIDRDPNAVTIGSDPYVVIRPEGRWHEPGILDRSSNRGVTRPSVSENA